MSPTTLDAPIERTTRDRLLDAAMALMLAKGFGATSVDDVCKSAGLTKGSFFYYFKSKDELGKAVLHHYWTSMRRMMDAATFHQSRDPLARVLAHLDLIVDMLEHPQMPKACLFGNLSQEISLTHPQVVSVCADAFSWWAETLQTDLDAAKRLYAPQSTIDTRTLATHIIAVYEGSLILAKAGGDLSVVRASFEHLKRYVGLLFPPHRGAAS